MFFLSNKGYLINKNEWRIFWRIHTPNQISEELREMLSNFELGVFFGVKIRQEHFLFNNSK